MSLRLDRAITQTSVYEPETMKKVRSEIDKLSDRRQIIVACRHQFMQGPAPEDLDGQGRTIVVDYLQSYELGDLSRGKWTYGQESIIEGSVIVELEITKIVATPTSTRSPARLWRCFFTVRTVSPHAVRSPARPRVVFECTLSSRSCMQNALASYLYLADRSRTLVKP